MSFLVSISPNCSARIWVEFREKMVEKIRQMGFLQLMAKMIKLWSCHISATYATL